jgi:hypothetical protein
MRPVKERLARIHEQPRLKERSSAFTITEHALDNTALTWICVLLTRTSHGLYVGYMNKVQKTEALTSV